MNLILAMSLDEFSTSTPPLVRKSVSALKVDGTMAIGTVIAITDRSVVIRLKSDKLLEIIAADLDKIEALAQANDPADLDKQPAVGATPAPLPDATKQWKVVAADKPDEKTAERRAAETRGRRYRLEAEDMRAQAATERATAANQMAGGVGSCVGSAAMAAASIFVCGIPLLTGSAIAAGLGIYFSSRLTQRTRPQRARNNSQNENSRPLVIALST